MTYEYKDVATCSVHHLTLSPDGSCLRCRNEVLGRERRSLHVKLALAGAVLTSVLAGSVVWAHVRASDHTTPPEVAQAPLLSAATPGLEVFQERIPRVTSPETHATLKQWRAELAKARAKEALDLAKEARARRAAEARDIRGARDAERIVAAAQREEQSSHGHGRAATPPSSHDHPTWWQGDPFMPRRACALAQRRAAMAAAARPATVATKEPSTQSFPETSF
jgi:regulator of protease activity HflC (stomatin/prohibitin superfamily)